MSAPDRGELRAASRSGPAAGRGVLRPGAGPRPAARRRRGRAMMTILLSGMLAGVPRQGGASWAVLQYYSACGGSAIAWCSSSRWAISAARRRTFESSWTPSGCQRRSSIRTAARPWGSAGRAAGGRRGGGPAPEPSGVLTDEEILQRISVRAFVDLDPAFTQLWRGRGPRPGIRPHNRFVTIGQALGSDGCAFRPADARITTRRPSCWSTGRWRTRSP